MSLYARSIKAKGRCDRCGFTVLLSTLKFEKVDGRKTGSRVCERCFDPDHPLNKRGQMMQRFTDPQTLRDPRPDADRQTVTSYFGWDPVGGVGLAIQIELGSVTVTVGA